MIDPLMLPWSLLVEIRNTHRRPNASTCGDGPACDNALRWGRVVPPGGRPRTRRDRVFCAGAGQRRASLHTLAPHLPHWCDDVLRPRLCVGSGQCEALNAAVLRAIDALRRHVYNPTGRWL